MSDKGVNEETVTLDGNLYFLCAQCNLCKNLPRPVDYNCKTDLSQAEKHLNENMDRRGSLPVFYAY